MRMTSGTIISIRVAALAAAVLLSGVGVAGTVKQLGATPDQDQLIQSLTPPPGSDAEIHERGLRILSGKPAGPDAGVPVVALDVRFALGSDRLSAAAQDTLDRVGKALQSSGLSGYRFLVEGHTDSTGRPDANLALSKRRAAAVKAYLVSNSGVDAGRLDTVGKGSTEPLDALHPASGVNRRVQIVNLGK